MRYIDADKLIAHLKDEIEGCKQPFGSRANGKGIAYGTELGLKSAISFAETLSTADVVPKSEVDKLHEVIFMKEDLMQSIAKERNHYYDELQKAKSEVESINPIKEAIEQKKKENKESALGVLNELLDEKDAEIKRLKAENKTLRGDLVIWKQNRFNLYQRLELYKIAREKVAREIFEEIENKFYYDDVGDFTIDHMDFQALKKKYAEGEHNESCKN